MSRGGARAGHRGPYVPLCAPDGYVATTYGPPSGANA